MPTLPLPRTTPPPAPDPALPGVAHRITPSQWRYVLETEGASGQGDDHGYSVVSAAAVTYDGRQLPVLTLTVPPKIKARLQVRLGRASGRPAGFLGA